MFDNSIIIIDGLDECDMKASVVVDSLAALNESDDSTIKTIFLSRDKIDIRERLECYTMVSIAARSSDLTLYVGAEIDLRMRKRRLRIKDQSLKGYITKRLVEGAEGMYVWCFLYHMSAIQILYFVLTNSTKVSVGNLPDGLFV